MVTPVVAGLIGLAVFAAFLSCVVPHFPFDHPLLPQDDEPSGSESVTASRGPTGAGCLGVCYLGDEKSVVPKTG